jgi:hypothetical protein
MSTHFTNTYIHTVLLANYCILYYMYNFLKKDRCDHREVPGIGVGVRFIVGVVVILFFGNLVV